MSQPVRPPVRDEVHVWTVPLGRRDRQLARDAMRAILRAYLDADSHEPGPGPGPERGPGHEPEPELDTTPTGKPYLRSGRLQFNLSHSREIALVAISGQAPVGIDVEHPRTFRAPDRLARRICSEREYAWLSRLGDPPGAASAEAQQQLLRLWVRKEALLKGTGEGLGRAPGEVDVLDDAPTGGWRILDLPSPAPGFHAAVAVRAPATALSHHRFTWS